MGKKKRNGMPNRKPLQSYLEISKSYSGDFTRTAHKFMRLIGLDPSDFDALSKRTKHELMQVKHTPYKIFADKESRVPRTYVKFFNSTLMHYEKRSFFGDPKYNITYLEYVTYGLSLIFTLRNYEENNSILPDQIHLVEKIKKPLIQYCTDHEEDHYGVRTTEVLNFLFAYVSQPNYRYYTGQEQGIPNLLKARMENQIHISSFEPERKNFVVDKEIRPSYRLGIYTFEKVIRQLKPTMVEIPMALLESESRSNQLSNLVKTKFALPVYIQNHALHRMAQRLDCADNFYRNVVFAVSFLVPNVITATNGQRLIAAKDGRGKTVGYFPFIKQDGAVLILSFLPLASPITPEGAILHKELGIQLDDTKFIGLDKLSYYVKTDFEVIPQLKKALKKANMWHLAEIETIKPTERKEDRILKTFLMRNSEFSEVEMAENTVV